MAAMIGKALPKKAEIKLALSGSSILYIVAPRSKDDQGVDAKLVGTVTLRLPKLRKIHKLIVELTGTANLSLEKTGYETGTTMKETLLLLEDSTLVAGEHTFDFVISIPSNTAPFERCPHGRIFQKAVARAVESGWLGSTLEDEAVFSVVLDSPNGDPSLFMARDLVDLRLGAYTFGFSSSSFSVGGLLSFSFNLQGSFEPVTIEHIDLFFIQQFTLTSLTHRLYSADPEAPPAYFSETKPAVRYLALRLDGNNLGKGLNHRYAAMSAGNVPVEDDFEAEIIANGGAFTPRSGKDRGPEPPRPAPRAPIPLAVLEAEEPFNVFHTFRMPRCDVLRPSASVRSLTPINKTLNLEAVVTYRLADHPEPQKLTITRGVDILSCHCLLSNVTLPGYDETGQSLDIVTPDRTLAHLHCADYVSSKVLMDLERNCKRSYFSDPSIMVRRPPQRTKWEEQTPSAPGGLAPAPARAGR